MNRSSIVGLGVVLSLAAFAGLSTSEARAESHSKKSRKGASDKKSPSTSETAATPASPEKAAPATNATPAPSANNPSPATGAPATVTTTPPPAPAAAPVVEKLLILPVHWRVWGTPPPTTEWAPRVKLFNESVSAALSAKWDGDVVDPSVLHDVLVRDRLATCMENPQCQHMAGEGTKADVVLSLTDTFVEGPMSRDGHDEWRVETTMKLFYVGGSKAEGERKIVVKHGMPAEVELTIQNAFVKLLNGLRGERAANKAIASSESKSSSGDGGTLKSVLKWGGVGGAVAGLALVGVGAYFLAIDGNGTCDLTAPAKQCPELWDTKTPGIALTAVGGALAIAGGVSLYLGLRMKEKPVAIAPMIAPGSFGLAAAGRF